MKNIVLVGFMGTGKSAVGKQLARGLNLKFLSTDDIIEEKERRRISEIFEISGEPYFRKVEKEVVEEVSGLVDVIIAAGGGAVLNEENMVNLRKNGIIVCLDAAAEVIYERTKRYKHRPLLNVENPIEEIRQLLETRMPFYAKADYRVDTSGKTVREVAKEIRGILNV